MRFTVEYAKMGTAGCKMCKEKIAKATLRIGKISLSPFGKEGGEDVMKQWFHVKCVFEQMKGIRIKAENKLKSVDELENWDDIADEDKALIAGLLKDFIATRK